MNESGQIHQKKTDLLPMRKIRRKETFFLKNMDTPWMSNGNLPSVVLDCGDAGKSRLRVCQLKQHLFMILVQMKKPIACGLVGT
ncbi:hypothetical protein D1970_08595 [Mesobacillus zeae]|uniref:Uncharacterized protein n=1 Tax=Mesobacillus zeae TaxID=1917180 RepID=A0A398BD68_9BACI|nr:hypothetical protein D1970_08595 [Mesobacillus zeae]